MSTLVMEDEDLTMPYDPELVLLDSPVELDADDLVLDEIDLDADEDSETSEVILLDTLPSSSPDDDDDDLGLS